MLEEKEVLKPCPFCGRTPNLQRSYFEYTIMHRCKYIQSVIGRGRKKEVINKWNTRQLKEE